MILTVDSVQALGAKMQVIGYARTSTEEQSNGIEAQRAQLQTEAERRGWTLEIRHEHASGKTLARRSVHLRAAGLSWQAMADRLNADMVRGPAGGRWHPTSVRRVHGYAMRGTPSKNRTAIKG